MAGVAWFWYDGLMDNLPVTDFQKGLSNEDAKRRLDYFGRNEFEKKREFSNLALLVAQFKSPLIYVLAVAGGATLFLQEWLDAFVIFLVVVVNTLLGFWQERKAAKSLEALKSYLKPQVMVLRGGTQRVLMEVLVPGDVVYLNAGASVPADGVLIQTDDFVVNEALLTGESRPRAKKTIAMEKFSHGKLMEVARFGPQEKGADNYVYMGTAVTAGVGTMLVLATGNKTEMGKIAKSLVTTEEGLTPLQQRLAGLARTLMYVVVASMLMILVVGLLRGEKVMVMFETAIAIVVAAVPEGLAVSMTVILAIGMQRILSRRALVRKLVAAETLGSVSVICCDKTGTLTEGKMRVVGLVGERDGLVLASLLANDERDEEGVAMADWARGELKKRPLPGSRERDGQVIREKFKRLSGIPFTSEKKYMATLNRMGYSSMVVVSGAPEQVLSMCNLSTKRRKEEIAKVREMAAKGYRLIGMASKRVQVHGELTQRSLVKLGWHGFLAFEDPVRERVSESLAASQAAGVEVKVITGDYKETAMAVVAKVFGRKIEDSEVVEGEKLSRMSKGELADAMGGIVLFARTTPDQKLKIVEALKDRGEVVAMTGDGVNDAPALKVADIGIVVDEATDVSKQTADLVLLDSNFGTIVEAIREGRMIYETMRKVVTYLISNAFQEIILIGGSLILGLPIPLSAVQILWINLVEDGLPGVALAFDVNDEGVMTEKPRKRSTPILDSEVKSLIGVIAVVGNVILLTIYAYLYGVGFDVDYLRSLMFLALGTNTLMFIFSVKSLKRNIWQDDLWSNKFLLFAVGVGLVLMGMSMFFPPLARLLGLEQISMIHFAFVMVINGLTMMLIELVKWVFVVRHAKISEVVEGGGA